nr:NUDIX domain-containing protein [Mycobacteroides salmoniphilum]
MTVRKQGSTRFMLPGGKPDVGESAAQTAVREVREELSVHLEPAALHYRVASSCPSRSVSLKFSE